jgi:rhodanese-related sulfurtransferase
VTASADRSGLSAPQPSLAAALLFAALGLASCSRAELAARAAGVDTLEPRALQRALEEKRFKVVDVRDPERYAQGHIPGALSVPSDRLDGFFSSAQAREPMVAVCDEGLLSLRAAAVALRHGRAAVLSMNGGMVRWQTENLPLEVGEQAAWPSSPPPTAPASALAQGMVVATAFAVKPLYMLLSLALALSLRGTLAPSLRLLRGSLFLFLGGEAACALNYLAAAGASDALEIGHELGMVLANALLPYALFDLVDRRLLHLTAPASPCLALRFCGRCFKREPVACGAHRLFLTAIPVLALVCLAPLCLPLEAGEVRVHVLGKPVAYSQSLLLELVQFRLLPLLGFVAYLLALGLLAMGERWTRRAAAPFFTGLGISSFALMRFALTRAFASAPPWADIWEELTELSAIAAVGALLWIFRAQFGLSGASAEAPRAAHE